MHTYLLAGSMHAYIEVASMVETLGFVYFALWLQANVCCMLALALQSTSAMHHMT